MSPAVSAKFANTGEVVSDGQGHRFLLKDVSCPTCKDSREIEVGWRGGRYHRYGLGVESRIVRCDRCRLLYPNPFPEPLDSQRLYADPDKYFAAHDTSERVAAFRSVAREICRRQPGRTPSLLDVGAGRGEMVQAARAEGMRDVVALEPSVAVRDSAETIHGVDALPFTIEEYAEQADRTFDAVTLNAVLEHVPDPDSMMATAAKLLHPGAILYLDIPNEDHLLARFAKLVNRARRSPAVLHLAPTFPPYHVWGFSPVSITRLLEKHGFQISELKVFAEFRVPRRSGLLDKAKAAVAQALQPVANATGTAHNMFIWARKIA